MSAIPLPERLCLVAVALLCALPFLQPYHLNPLTAFYSEWLAFVLGCGVAMVLLLRRAWNGACLPWIALAPLLLALLLFVHGLLDRSPYFGQALSAALYLLWAALLVLAGAALARLAGRGLLFDTLAAGLALGALASALVGLIQHLQLPTLLDAWVARATGAAIFGNLAQANHFAAYTTLGLLSFAYLRQRARIGVIVLVAAAAPVAGAGIVRVACGCPVPAGRAAAGGCCPLPQPQQSPKCSVGPVGGHLCRVCGGLCAVAGHRRRRCAAGRTARGGDRGGTDG